MKKNGFVFIETIVSIIILTSALLLLYTSFNKILQSEKSRVYYDDINYIYRTWYIKTQLEELNFNAVLTSFGDQEDKYFLTLGTETENLFTGHFTYQNYIISLYNDFDVRQAVIIKENKLDDIKRCNKSCAMDSTCENYNICNHIFTNLSEDMINYLNSIYIDVSTVYILAVEYNTCNSNNTSCRNYYSWVSV